MKAHLISNILFLLTFFFPFCFSDEIIFGSIRVQTLSETLLRIEPMGPLGFEDRTTFMVVNRDFPGIPIRSVNQTKEGTIVMTDYYRVVVKQEERQKDVCVGMAADVWNAGRSPNFAGGAYADDAGSCCALCKTDPMCNGWVFNPEDKICYPLNSWGSLNHESPSPRTFGCLDGSCYSIVTNITVSNTKGEVLFTQTGFPSDFSSKLHWPSPLNGAQSYLVTDYPRFYVPKWGPSPQPPNNMLNIETNGYDYKNNIAGDSYIFLLGTSLESWFASRSEFLKLTGPTPLIPDYAFGTWFTWWHSYTEEEAKNDIEMWRKCNLPIDIWGLDMNWRNTSDDEDRFYNFPNSALFPNFTEWFEYLHSQNLRTYFNDHPFPVDWQTSPTEVGFRYGGLSNWMARGLDFWWFDHNWGFSIPPPNILPVDGWNVSYSNGNWLGLDNVAWGSHVYFESVYNYYQYRDTNVRPMSLTKFDRSDWTDDLPSETSQEHPSHHRYPVWWTGDGVSIKSSIETMVNSGVHDLKPYVHSDCGGDRRGSAGDLLRWTAHCTFGTILRFHGDDHRPWTYDTNTENVILSYLNIRYKLIPSFIAAGHVVTTSGYPIVVRCDLLWPQFPESTSDLQYIHLNETLVAPIWDSTSNITSRTVWIPPGIWSDAWDGSVVTGPIITTVTKPYEQIPIWHRRGGFLITSDSTSRRVTGQDWSTLTLEVFPDLTENHRHVTRRVVYSLGNSARTDISMESTGNAESGLVEFMISPSEDNTSRAYTIRLHLLPGEKCIFGSVNGVSDNISIKHIQPVHSSIQFFPFGGAGSAPAYKAGPIAEAEVGLSNDARLLQFKIVKN